MVNPRIEAVVDRDIAGKRVVDAFLRLEGQYRAPAGHVLGPFDGMDPDIGAAIDGRDAVAITDPAQIERMDEQIDFIGVITAPLQELQADTAALVGIGQVLIEPV